MRARGHSEQFARSSGARTNGQGRNASSLCRATAAAQNKKPEQREAALLVAAGGAGLAGTAPPGALFLGIDLSTQSCTAVVDGRLDVVHRHSVNFDERLKDSTESGYHAGDEVPRRRPSPCGSTASIVYWTSCPNHSCSKSTPFPSAPARRRLLVPEATIKRPSEGRGRGIHREELTPKHRTKSPRACAATGALVPGAFV